MKKRLIILYTLQLTLIMTKFIKYSSWLACKPVNILLSDDKLLVGQICDGKIYSWNNWICRLCSKITQFQHFYILQRCLDKNSNIHNCPQISTFTWNFLYELLLNLFDIYNHIILIVYNTNKFLSIYMHIYNSSSYYNFDKPYGVSYNHRVKL